MKWGKNFSTCNDGKRSQEFKLTRYSLFRKGIGFRSGSRNKKVSMARRIYLQLPVRKVDYPVVEVA